VTRRTALGIRANAAWLRNYSTTPLPYYLRFFLGGETQIRGTDIRTVGPLNANNVALGGTKYVLFNAEYYFDIAAPVRALLFHDAGQMVLSRALRHPGVATPIRDIPAEPFFDALAERGIRIVEREIDPAECYAPAAV
jgi:outer membrane protein assembly factor BamA